ncbi:MAG: peptidoglycan DD-metalloendopeptidase family protein [Alkalispirochaetaceae bacterium]
MVSFVKNQHVRRRSAVKRLDRRKAPGSSYRGPRKGLKNRALRLIDNQPTRRRTHLSRSIAAIRPPAVRLPIAPLRELSRWLFRGYRHRDLPLYVAALLTILTVNLTMERAISDTVLARERSGFALPLLDESSRVLWNRVSADEPDFDVIDASITVDTEKFLALEVESYTIQPGDTLSDLASENDLTLDTLISFNQIKDARRIQIGDTYRIPNRDGLLYEVRSGDSLAAIASKYGTSVNAILDANDMRSREISTGEVVFVPEARMNSTELKLILGELFRNPTMERFTSGFGMRADPFTGLPRFHNGIDLANIPGTPIRAAGSGRVAHIESQIGNYGRFVILRHDSGFQTLYAHLDSFDVRVGQFVYQGDVIGRMGNTGRSTGPHLHFSVIRNGRFVDPLNYLP